MNFIEMIKILMDNPGANGVLPGCDIKLRMSSFSGLIYQHDNNVPCGLYTTQILSKDWEIHFAKQENPKLHTFEEAITALKRGKTIYRSSIPQWTYDMSVCNFNEE